MTGRSADPKRKICKNDAILSDCLKISLTLVKLQTVKARTLQMVVVTTFWLAHKPKSTSPIHGLGYEYVYDKTVPSCINHAADETEG